MQLELYATCNSSHLYVDSCMFLLHVSSETNKPDLCCVGRFLYRHLLMFYSQTPSLTAKSVFQRNSDSTLLSLKSGTSLHLYVNQLPKGAAPIPFKLSRSWRTGRKFNRPTFCMCFWRKSLCIQLKLYQIAVNFCSQSEIVTDTFLHFCQILLRWTPGVWPIKAMFAGCWMTSPKKSL